jgi:hypothetical protein
MASTVLIVGEAVRVRACRATTTGRAQWVGPEVVGAVVNTTKSQAIGGNLTVTTALQTSTLQRVTKGVLKSLAKFATTTDVATKALEEVANAFASPARSQETGLALFAQNATSGGMDCNALKRVLGSSMARFVSTTACAVTGSTELAYALVTPIIQVPTAVCCVQSARTSCQTKPAPDKDGV